MLKTALAVALLCAPLTAHAETGMASWYGFESGTRTASGERFNPRAMTCAMRVRTFGHSVKVTVISTGRSATCRVNDYGPAKRTGRIIDVFVGNGH